MSLWELLNTNPIIIYKDIDYVYVSGCTYSDTMRDLWNLINVRCQNLDFLQNVSHLAVLYKTEKLYKINLKLFIFYN